MEDKSRKLEVRSQKAGNVRLPTSDFQLPVDYPSPNFNDRDLKVPLRYIVLHYTGMPTRDEALRRLCDPQAEVSAHYVIDEEGKVFHLVDESKRAWHAGKSFWRGVTDMNSASIGIELVNPGHEFGHRPFPAKQIEALKVLLRDIVQRNKLNPAMALLGHSDIAPARKQDPGELFPWRELAAAGFGLWPQTRESDYAPAKEGEAQRLLRAIGYDCLDNAEGRRLAVLAFQRRYVPDHLTGDVDRQTLAMLRAVARM